MIHKKQLQNKVDTADTLACGRGQMCVQRLESDEEEG